MSSLRLKEAAAAAAMITEARMSCMVAGVWRVTWVQHWLDSIYTPHWTLISTPASYQHSAARRRADHLYQYCNYKETLVASAGVDTDTAGCGEGHFPSQKMFVDMLMMSTISNKYLIKNFENDD